MTPSPVEWILVVRYGISAHRATYGRLAGNSYTKDYIQLSKKSGFVGDLRVAFPDLNGSAPSIDIAYVWPNGSADGKIFLQSADRPHLAWHTNSAPTPWRMFEHPTALSVETIRGNPSHSDPAAADREYDALTASGFGQPYLIAIKLKGQPNRLHLRVHIGDPEDAVSWADLAKVPVEVQELAAATSVRSALAWRLFPSDDDDLLLFDPADKVDPWNSAGATRARGADTRARAPQHPAARNSSEASSDVVAESLDYSNAEVSDLNARIDAADYGVPDAMMTTKTRGSAQRAFSQSVKRNYGWQCAVTGIKTTEFLVGSHIVPWSDDESIRLDPANGICLSVLVDKAFENGFIIFNDDLTVSVDWKKVGDDNSLKQILSQCDKIRLAEPSNFPPKVEYLQRRRARNNGDMDENA